MTGANTFVITHCDRPAGAQGLLREKTRVIAENLFVHRQAQIEGCSITYHLHEQPVRLLKGKLRLRQITRLCEGGHQTQILTSRWDLRDIEVAYRMFERWRQENYFKYMREEFLLDALVDYRIEPEDPTRTAPNPERRAGALLDRITHHVHILEMNADSYRLKQSRRKRA